MPRKWHEIQYNDFKMSYNVMEIKLQINFVAVSSYIFQNVLQMARLLETLVKRPWDLLLLQFWCKVNLPWIDFSDRGMG